MQVTTSIYNLILGKLYVDHYGTMRIQGNRELSCKLKFKEQSIIDRNPHQVLSPSSSVILEGEVSGVLCCCPSSSHDMAQHASGFRVLRSLLLGKGVVTDD